MMNGFLPTSTPVALQQWWRTRDQGDSLAVAQRLADIVGIDFYPRHALASAGPLTVYLDGSRPPRRGRGRGGKQRRRVQLLDRAAAAVRRTFYQDGYLFWGAEYGLLRERQGDPSYLRAFARVLERTG